MRPRMAVGGGGRNAEHPVARPLVATRVVPGTPEQVFDLLADLDNHDWIGGRWLDVVQVRRRAGTAVGADLALRRPFVADRPATTTVEHLDRPGALVGRVAVPDVASARLTWELEPAPGGAATHVRLTVVPLELRRRDRLWLVAGGRRWLDTRLRAMLARLGDRTGAGPHAGRGHDA